MPRYLTCTLSAVLLLSAFALPSAIPKAQDAEHGSLNVTITEGVERNDIVYPGEATAGAKVTMFNLTTLDRKELQSNAAGHANVADAAPGIYQVIINKDGKTQQMYVRVKSGQTASAVATVLTMRNSMDAPDNVTKAVNDAISACDREALKKALMRLEKLYASYESEVADLDRFIEDELRLQGLPDDPDKIQQRIEELKTMDRDRREQNFPLDAKRVAGSYFEAWAVKSAMDLRINLRDRMKTLEVVRAKASFPASCSPGGLARPAAPRMTGGVLRPGEPPQPTPGTNVLEGLSRPIWELRLVPVPTQNCSAAALTKTRNDIAGELKVGKAAQDSLKAYADAINERTKKLNEGSTSIVLGPRNARDWPALTALANEQSWIEIQWTSLNGMVRTLEALRKVVDNAKCPPGAGGH